MGALAAILALAIIAGGHVILLIEVVRELFR